MLDPRPFTALATAFNCRAHSPHSRHVMGAGGSNPALTDQQLVMIVVVAWDSLTHLSCGLPA